MKNYYFIYIILYSSILIAQDISGSIKDRITDAFLSGVNITIQNSEYGASSDELGNYVLDITDFKATFFSILVTFGYFFASSSISFIFIEAEIKLFFIIIKL